jgi:hypothetical protein
MKYVYYLEMYGMSLSERIDRYRIAEKQKHLLISNIWVIHKYVAQWNVW